MNDKHDNLYMVATFLNILQHFPSSTFENSSNTEPHDGRPWHHHAEDLPEWRPIKATISTIPMEDFCKHAQEN